MRHVLPRGALEDPADSTLDAMEANTYYVLYWRELVFVLYCTGYCTTYTRVATLATLALSEDRLNELTDG